MTRSIPSTDARHPATAVITITGRGKVVYLNEGAERMLGVQRIDALRRPVADLLVPAERRNPEMTRLASVLAEDPSRLVDRELEVTITGPDGLTFAAEIALARKLNKFPDAIRMASESLRPHYLGLYLFELAGDYSSFNNADKVLVDDPAVRARRLLLCARTLLVLETGLRLLGLRTLTRM